MDPATALTVPEAATHAGVGIQEIEGSMADGSLLFETQRQKGREVPMIRLMDLADVYPSLRPAVEPELPAEEASPAAVPVDAQVNAPAKAPMEPAAEAPDEYISLPQLFSMEDEPAPATAENAVADAVRASGADRDQLINLCQDLETRLDLAERERQASTASLLMAQRRVLDLEHRRDRRPMAMAAAATLGVFGLALAFLAFRLPKTVSAAARDQVRQVESRLAEQSAQLEATIEASLASARADERVRSDAAKAKYEAQIAALEARLGESRKLQVAELEKVTAIARDHATGERTAAAAQRAKEAEERRAELAAWEERIHGAELATVAAREALKLERVLNGADRAAFRAELNEALAKHNEALDTALDRMQKSQSPATVLPFGPIGIEEAPAPWWKRALQDLRD